MKFKVVGGWWLVVGGWWLVVGGWCESWSLNRDSWLVWIVEPESWFVVGVNRGAWIVIRGWCESWSLNRDPDRCILHRDPDRCIGCDPDRCILHLSCIYHHNWYITIYKLLYWLYCQLKTFLSIEKMYMNNMMRLVKIVIISIVSRFQWIVIYEIDI